MLRFGDNAAILCEAGVKGSTRQFKPTIVHYLAGSYVIVTRFSRLRDMTGEKSAGVFAHHDLAKHHHRSSNQKDIAVITASLYPRYQPALFRD